MADLLTTWGGVELPNPELEGIRVEEVIRAATTRSLSGILHVDVLSWYHKITLSWPVLDVADWTTLYGAYDANRYAPSQLVLPDGQTFDDVVCVSDWPEDHFYEVARIPYYTVKLTFEDQVGTIGGGTLPPVTTGWSLDFTQSNKNTAYWAVL